MSPAPYGRLEFAIVLGALSLGACARSSGSPGPRAWIDQPLDGAELPLAPVTILAHASDEDGIAVIEFSVSGSVLAGVSAGGKRLGEASLQWSPSSAGEYAIGAVAIDGAGNRGWMSQARILVVDSTSATSTPTPAPALLPTETPTPASACPGGPHIGSFTASPGTLAAGQSATLSWGGILNADLFEIAPEVGGVAATGSVVVRPAATTVYTLAVGGCGGTSSAQVTVVVLAPTLPPAPTHVPTLDLAVTDLYPDNLPQGRLFTRITNNGPSDLSSDEVWLSCSAVLSDPIEGTQETVTADPSLLLVSLVPGETGIFNTGILVDTSSYWYAVTCSVEMEAFIDPNPANDEYTENFP
ncbi:MAG TPA: Ig-like domain-containing protein [Anaerolineales bacterium]|nr:Ig-like domain-containing protein [Anaerolineales bacterium]